MIYKLVSPVSVPPFDSLTEMKLEAPIRRKHLRGIDMMKVLKDDVITIAGRMAGVQDVVLDELEIVDMDGIAEVIYGFLISANGQCTEARKRGKKRGRPSKTTTEPKG